MTERKQKDIESYEKERGEKHSLRKRTMKIVKKIENRKMTLREITERRKKVRTKEIVKNIGRKQKDDIDRNNKRERGEKLSQNEGTSKKDRKKIET